MATTATAVAALDGGFTAVPRQRVDDLAARLSQPVLHDGDAGWGDVLHIWNGMVASTPSLVVQPVSADEVAAVIGFAREHRLQLSVRGGGHNIAGTSLADHALTLDMSHMRGIRVDPVARLAHVGPGALLGDLDRATQEHGLATVLGFISEVGVAGLTLGGGLGYLTRRFGWTVDNLEEVQIVTADGTIRVANREENADLFWAVRGGGGNFGVVTRFTLRLHPVGPMVYGGLIAWPFERVSELLAAYRTITSEAPRELAVWLVLIEAPPAPFVPVEWHGKRVVAMAVCFTGALTDVDRVLAPIRALGKPVVDLLAAQPYTQVQSYLDVTEPRGAHYYWKTEYLTELSDGFLAKMADLFAQCPCPGAELGVLHLAGALNEHDWDDGAVGNRDVRYVLGVNGMWAPDEPREVEFTRWVRDAWEQLRPFTAGRTYINFQTSDEDDARIHDTYGANFARLAEIKRAYDPANLFRVNRNIAPT